MEDKVTLNTTELETYARYFSDHWAYGMKKEIPPHMHEGLVNYLVFRIAPGSFLTSVIRGNFFDMVMRADDVNMYALPNYGRFFINFAPSNSFGSPETMNAWLAINSRTMSPRDSNGGVEE